jgi:hypothetical protein
MNSYVARLLDIIKNASISSDLVIATVVDFHKVGDRSAVSNYKPINIITVNFRFMVPCISDNNSKCRKNRGS